MGLTKETLLFLNGLNLPEEPKGLTLGVQSGPKLPWPVDTLDISDYEGANVKWDLNLPINEGWHNQYDIVIDGGTLEHVFNTLTALDNCYNLLRIKGHFVSHQIMNYCGHGFYQFCPEFFFKWSNWMGMINPRCWVYSPTGSGIRLSYPFNSRENMAHWPREEYETFSHVYFLFSAEKINNALLRGPFPQQAEPTKDNKFKHWFWNTKLWSRTPVPLETKQKKK